MSKQYIHDKLEQVVRVERGIWVARALTMLIAYGAVIAACHFFLDWSFRPGVGLRGILLLGFVGALGYAVWREVVLPWKRFPTRDEAALEVERTFPALEGRFISSYQLSRSSGGGSPQLIAVLTEETTTRVRQVDVRSVPDRRGRNRSAATAGALLLAWVFFVGFTPTGRGGFFVWAERLLNPFSEREYPTKTLITVENGNRIVARGDDVELRARVAGVVPASGSVRIRRGERGWIDQPIQGSRRDFIFVQKSAVESFDYYWKLGDGRSQVYHVEVVVPPQVRGINARYEFPSYTRRAPETVFGGNLEALPGTRATLTVRANKRTSEGTLLLEDGTEIKLAAQGETTYTASLMIVEESAYRIRLIDEHGFENRDPMEYAITPQPDEIPRVALRNIPERKFVTRYAALPVEIQCRDDYGITQVQVHLGIPGEEEKVIDVPVRSQQNQQTVSYVVRLDDWELEPGSEVTLWASALDNRAIGEPQRGFSSKAQLEIVTPEELIRLMRDRMEALLPRLENITKESVASKSAVEEIVGNGKTSDEPTTASR